MSAHHVLITGASGGIGSAVGSVMHSRGWTVTGTDVRLPPPGDEKHRGWTVLEVDIGDSAALAWAIEQARAVAPVTAIVHAAAVQPLGAVGEMSMDVWEQTLRVNVLALEQLVQTCLDDLRASRGSVVAVSSVHAHATTPGIAAYSTSKAALEGWVRAAALDLGPEIRVNAVAPGAVRTPMLVDGLARRPGSTVDEALAQLASLTPLAIVAEPMQLAQLVAVLLDSELTGFVTGSVFRADGGALLKLGTE